MKMTKDDPVLTGLSPEQQAAVAAMGAAIRVNACAGAGKTEVMSRRILHALREGVPPEEIVAFTFMERAAEEMKARLLKRVGEILGTAARNAVGRLSVSTIHAYCLRLLQDHGDRGNFDLLDEHQERAFLSKHGFDLQLQEIVSRIAGEDVGYSESIIRFRASASVVYNELIGRARLRGKSPDFADLLDAYERLLDDHRLITFDRVIVEAVDLLRARPDAKPRLRHLLVDEYQDVNLAQVELAARLVGTKTSLFVVGDANQSIYEWRGSNPECFEQFSRRFSGARDLKLIENRRSRDGIIDAANAFGAAMSPSWTDMRGIRHDRPVSAWMTPFGSPEEEADWVVAKIRRMRAEGRPYREIAILLGSVDTAGAPFIDRLKEAGIPYEVGGRSGLFRHDTAQALGRIFAWFAGHEWRPDRWDRSQDLQGDEVLNSALDDFLGVSGAVRKRLEREMRRICDSAQQGRYENFVELFQDVLIALGVRELKPDDEKDAVLMSVWGRFNTLLNDYEAMRRRVSADPDRGRGSRKLDWPSALKSFAWYLTLYAANAYEEPDGDDASGEAVRVTTIHQSKGLEWPVVFLPSLQNNRFPTANRSRDGEWLVDTALFEVARYEGDEESRRRVLYVAMTRARDGLFVSWVERKGKRRSNFLDSVEKAVAPPKATAATPVPPDPNARAAERELRTFTPTELIHYRRCPYRWRLSQVWGFQAGLKPELGFGRAQHHVLRGIAEKAAKGAPVTVELVRREAEEAFYLPYAPAGMREDMKSNALPKLFEYSRAQATDLSRTVQAEARIEFPVANALISGTADVIHGDGGEEEVRDYKSGEDELSMPEADFQVQLYGAGLRKTGRPIRRGSVANLERNEVRPVDVSAGALARAERMAEQTVDAILRREFPAKPGPICTTCDFEAICRFAAAKD